MVFRKTLRGIVGPVRHAGAILSDWERVAGTEGRVLARVPAQGRQRVAPNLKSL